MEDENKIIEAAVDVNGENDDEENLENDDVQTPDPADDVDKSHHPQTGDGASPGKIFIGGLARETTSAQFLKHFGQYGEITDSVIMKDRMTGQPRGFGFVTYADESVVDKVIGDTHILNGKQVEIKRTIPRGAGGSKDFKTKKIFVGGIPTSVTEDEFKDFFTKFGEVKEHQIMRDHSSGRSRGFGFVTFELEQAVDDLLSNGNRIEFSGVQVEIKKAEPKKPNPPPPAPSKRRGNPKSSFGGGYGDAYGSYGGGAGSYRSGGGGAYGARGSGGYGGGYGGSEFGSYGGYGGGSYGGYRGEPASLGYSSRYGGGGYGRGYDMGGGGGYGGLGDSYGGGYGGAGGGPAAGGGYGGGYDTGYGGGGGYGGGSGGVGEGSFYGSRGGYGGSGGAGGGGGGGGGGRGRYHPYGR